VASNCTLDAREPSVRANLGLRVSPHPAHSQSRVEMNLPFDGNVRGRIRNVLGQELAVFQADNAAAGAFTLPLDLSAFSGNQPWTGFLEVQLTGSGKYMVQAIPLIVERQ
jgi:hypothetical protein